MGKITWRPALLLAAALLTAGTNNALIQAQGLFRKAAPATDTNAETQKLLTQLSEVGGHLLATNDAHEIVVYTLRQADILGRLSGLAQPKERPAFLRQMADCLHSAALSSTPQDKTAYGRLVQLNEQVAAAAPGGDLSAYVALRTLQADYAARIAAPGADMNQSLVYWRHQLEGFVQSYPTSAETPKVVMELGTLSESLARPDDARRAYQYVLNNFPEHAVATKARAALNQLNLDGKVLHLALPLLLTDDPRSDTPFDIAQLRGKVVVVYFWATTSPGSAGELAQLKSLLARHRAKGLEVLCVNLDASPDLARNLLHRSAPAGIQVFQRGGLEGQAVRRFGLTTTPAVFVLDREGRLVNRTVAVGELHTAISRSLSAPAPAGDASPEIVRIRYSPWSR